MFRLFWVALYLSDVTMCSVYMFIFIFWLVDSFWNRGTSYLGNSLLYHVVKSFAFRVNVKTKFCVILYFALVAFSLRRNKLRVLLVTHFLESTWNKIAWKPQYTAGEQWLQVDLNQVKKIKAIATQGLSHDGTSSYCQSYTVSYSKSGAIWQEYKENDAIKVRKVTRSAIRIQQELTLCIGFVWSVLCFTNLAYLVCNVCLQINSNKWNHWYRLSYV